MMLPLSAHPQDTCFGSEIKPAEQPSDWTDFFDRPSVIRTANNLIDELILKIHQEQFPIHSGLDAEELALLYRFPIHVGVNIFIERLLRVAYSRAMGWNQTYPEVFCQPRYFKDTDEAIMTHYADFALNNNLLHLIFKALGGPVGQKNTTAIEQPRPQDSLLNKPFNIFDRAKNVIKALFDLYVKVSKPDVVGEYSNWMREILPSCRMLRFNFPTHDYLVDEATRAGIRACCRTVFIHHLDSILDSLEEEQKIKLSDIFADLIDHILPQTIVEGLAERLCYYEKLIKGWKIRQVHSFIGYFYKENFKIFAILARRKGALLIGHQHGASNPKVCYRNIYNELSFVDYYFTWGKNDNEWMKGDKRLEKLKIIGLGSTYLTTIPKWRKKHIDRNKITIFYPSGPLVDFMTDLEETATREKTYCHRLEFLALLKELMRRYPNMKLLYKPFPGTFTEDPIKKIFSEEIAKGSVQVIDISPVRLYSAVDVVLWDFISTGFAESIQSEVPTLVFQSIYEYETAAPLGKELNQELMKCGMIFHDAASGLKSFHSIVDNLPDFIESRRPAVKRFQDAVAYPVQKKDFLRRSRAVLEGVNR